MNAPLSLYRNRIYDQYLKNVDKQKSIATNFTYIISKIERIQSPNQNITIVNVIEELVF